MMNINIPDNHWQPLSRVEVIQGFANAPFTWGIAGGYAVEQFLGKSIRDHCDTDIMVP